MKIEYIPTVDRITILILWDIFKNLKIDRITILILWDIFKNLKIDIGSVY
jgi:hypothetical protein